MYFGQVGIPVARRDGQQMKKTETTYLFFFSYCRVTNYQYLSLFFRSEIWSWQSWVSCPGSHKAEIKVGARLGSHLEFRFLFLAQVVVGKVSTLHLWDWGPVSLLTVSWGSFSSSGGCPESSTLSHHSHRSITLKSRNVYRASTPATGGLWGHAKILPTTESELLTLSKGEIEGHRKGKKRRNVQKASQN